MRRRARTAGDMHKTMTSHIGLARHPLLTLTPPPGNREGGGLVHSSIQHPRPLEPASPHKGQGFRRTNHMQGDVMVTAKAGRGKPHVRHRPYWDGPAPDPQNGGGAHSLRAGGPSGEQHGAQGRAPVPCDSPNVPRSRRRSPPSGAGDERPFHVKHVQPRCRLRRPARGQPPDSGPAVATAACRGRGCSAWPRATSVAWQRPTGQHP